MSEQLVPFFQPIIDSSTAEVVGHEVLARLQKSTGEIESAGSWFSSIEKSRAERLDADRSIREQALKKFAQMGQPGYLTLNISPEWIESCDGADLFTIDLVKSAGIDSQKIVIEIIESACDIERLQEAIQHYKDFGFKVAIDDFGAGHSSFDRVLALKPDIIKLDMSLFNRALAEGGHAAHLIDSICYLGERLGSLILAEGVECLDGFSYSQKFGAQLIQGYLFSEAKSNFSESFAFEERIQLLRYTYVEQQTKALVKQDIIRQVLDTRLIDLTHELRNHHLNLDLLNKLQHPHLYRAYVCNYLGDQVSDDFLYAKGEWKSESVNRNTNFSCRPFYCQLMSKLELDMDVPATSVAYHDLNSKQRIQTVGCKIKDGLTLFLDINCS